MCGLVAMGSVGRIAPRWPLSALNHYSIFANYILSHGNIEYLRGFTPQIQSNMKYFTIQELSASATAERLAIDNTPPRAAQQMLTVLVEQLLDPIRRRYGAPIIVTSGYRCPALNTAVGGVANSHHILGCAADIVAPLLSPQGGKNQTAPFLSSPLDFGPFGRRPSVGGSEGGCGDQTQYLFHLIVQMQREGQIRFTQLIAEKGYRWLHISYVPGMLRNQIIDINTNTVALSESPILEVEYQDSG